MNGRAIISPLLVLLVAAGCQKGNDTAQENALLREENRQLRARLAETEGATGTTTASTTASAPASGSRSYQVRSGDTLMQISKQMYGDRSRWADIYQANRGVIGTDHDRLEVGMTLAIPPLGSSR